MNRIETALAKNKNAGFTLELLAPKYLLTWAGILILKLSTFLPYDLLMKLGNIMGNVIYKVSPTRAEIVKINLEKCLAVKGKELENLVKLNFQALGRGIFEMAYAWWASEKKIRNGGVYNISPYIMGPITAGLVKLDALGVAGKLAGKLWEVEIKIHM